MLASFISYEVLANFDFHMKELALLAVNRDRIVRGVGHPVRLVVTNDETLLAAQKIDQRMGEARVAVVEQADMPWPRDRIEDGRKAVHRD